MTDMDPEIQRIIEAAEPGVLDLIAAYELYEHDYMPAAYVPQSTITAGSTTTPTSL